MVYLMQTFLRYPDFKKSLQALDYRRLGKQRVEACQIIRVIKFGGGWQHHPIAKMWRGHVNALKLYHNICIDEWLKRGYRNNMKKINGMNPKASCGVLHPLLRRIVQLTHSATS